ncbi:hypothetical protein PILCRDRAFT_818774 [Piloderma croceum F 1598]|uniref:Uncharacterized protein n=1 Tax=Piloderma croceum (strain F 1598) TaxID=765440 RepID=A0A0C3BDK9_PILCF|nr:hypothetical protein PILCRDRAFT_818774 [Piloderma croceum F 1598]
MINGVRPDDLNAGPEKFRMDTSEAICGSQPNRRISGLATPVTAPAVCIGRMTLSSYDHFNLCTILVAVVCLQMLSKVRSQQHDNMDTIANSATTPFFAVKTA